jgi:hypothetical protein
MIELELPCCGGTTRLAELADDIRCEDCGVAVELAPDAPAAAPGLATAARIPALAA